MTRLARLLVLLPDEMLSEIDVYRRYSPDLPPRTEAIRRLVRAGLDTSSGVLHSPSSHPLAKEPHEQPGAASGVERR